MELLLELDEAFDTYTEEHWKGNHKARDRANKIKITLEGFTHEEVYGNSEITGALEGLVLEPTTESHSENTNSAAKRSPEKRTINKDSQKGKSLNVISDAPELRINHDADNVPENFIHQEYLLNQGSEDNSSTNTSPRLDDLLKNRDEVSTRRYSDQGKELHSSQIDNQARNSAVTNQEKTGNGQSVHNQNNRGKVQQQHQKTNPCNGNNFRDRNDPRVVSNGRNTNQKTPPTSTNLPSSHSQVTTDPRSTNTGSSPTSYKCLKCRVFTCSTVEELKTHYQREHWENGADPMRVTERNAQRLDQRNLSEPGLRSTHSDNITNQSNVTDQMIKYRNAKPQMPQKRNCGVSQTRDISLSQNQTNLLGDNSLSQNGSNMVQNQQNLVAPSHSLPRQIKAEPNQEIFPSSCQKQRPLSGWYTSPPRTQAAPNHNQPTSAPRQMTQTRPVAIPQSRPQGTSSHKRKHSSEIQSNNSSPQSINQQDSRPGKRAKLSPSINQGKRTNIPAPSPPGYNGGVPQRISPSNIPKNRTNISTSSPPVYIGDVPQISPSINQTQRSQPTYIPVANPQIYNEAAAAMNNLHQMNSHPTPMHLQQNRLHHPNLPSDKQNFHPNNPTFMNKMQYMQSIPNQKHFQPNSVPAPATPGFQQKGFPTSMGMPPPPLNNLTGMPYPMNKQQHYPATSVPYPTPHLGNQSLDINESVNYLQSMLTPPAQTQNTTPTMDKQQFQQNTIPTGNPQGIQEFYNNKYQSTNITVNLHGIPPNVFQQQNTFQAPNTGMSMMNMQNIPQKSSQYQNSSANTQNSNPYNQNFPVNMMPQFQGKDPNFAYPTNVPFYQPTGTPASYYAQGTQQFPNQAQQPNVPSSMQQYHANRVPMSNYPMNFQSS